MEPFGPQDVALIKQAGHPRISPDESMVAFTVTTPDTETNEYLSRILVAEALQSGGPVSEISPGPKDIKPRWSPDSSKIAFVGHVQEKGSEIYVVASEGGEATKLAEFPEEVEELEWSPDGSKIAFTMRDRDEDQYGPEKDKDKPPRHIDRLSFRLDGTGWTIDRPRHLFVIAAEGGEPRQLTFGDFQDSSLSWSPDGTRIAFTSGRHDTWDVDFRSDLFTVDVVSQDLEQLTETDGSYSFPAWSPDGSQIAFAYKPDPLDGPRHSVIGSIDVDTSEVRLLSQELDRNASPMFAQQTPIWNEGDIYFIIEDSGNNHLYRVPSGGKGKPEGVITEKGQVGEFDLKGRTTAHTHTSSTTIPDLFVGTTRVSALSITNRELVDPISFEATSSDGTEVPAWVMRPANFDTDKKYPLLLNIHGGPFTQYGDKFFDEFQVYAGAGYAVVYSNPRGSAGYSEAWGRAIRGRSAPDPGSGWGGVDYEDLMAVVDTAIERFPFIDPDRLGVMGGSYGGYMTSWIVGHTDRFSTAISERALNDHNTFAYTSDIGPIFRSYFGKTYLEDPEEHARMSPITYLDNITTPMLILHSENDLRCPISQAEEMFFALKLLGKDVEFVRFPGEGHELSRSGAPRHRVQRFEVILDYLNRHL